MHAPKPTVVELAHLSNLVYGSNYSVKVVVSKPPLAPPTNPEQEWSLLTPCPYPGGFFAALYKRQDGCRALAFRGTDDLADVFRDDLSIYHAISFARSVKLSPEDAVTGHSLGGALALLVAAATNRPAVTFNAPGIADECARVAESDIGRNLITEVNRQCGGSQRVLNIRVGGDLVSSPRVTGRQVGGKERVVTLPDVNGCTARAAVSALSVASKGVRFGPKVGAAVGAGAFLGGNALCRHQMETVLAAVQRDPRFFLPIDL